MAKVKITGHASGTGVLTITAPNTSTDRTITLPDACPVIFTLAIYISYAITQVLPDGTVTLMDELMVTGPADIALLPLVIE